MGNRYDPIIAEASRRFGVPEERIRAVMQVESSGNPASRSPKGAAGLMQVMPGTYTDLARRHALGPDRFDPRNNIMAGTAYLGEMFEQFQNWDEATQAYNMGPGRAMRVRNGTATVPAETAAYLPKVNAALGISTNGGQGGDMVPGLRRPQPGQTSGMGAVFGAARPGQSLTGLLEVDDENNFYDGLGNLFNAGQTRSQPPGPSIGSANAQGGGGNTSNAQGGRIDTLIDQLSQPVDRSNRMGAGGMMMQGALGAVLPLAGERGRKVGIGELLGSLGSGLTRGSAAFQQQQKDDRAEQVGELGNLMKVDDYRTKQATTARQMQAANAYADQIQSINPALAAAVRGNPSLMDEIAKAQAAQTFQKDEPTNQHRNAVAMGYRPGSPEYIAYVRQSSMPAGATTVNMGTAEKEEDREFGKELVKEYADVRGAGMAAENQLRQLEIARKIPVVTGSTAPLFAKVGAVAESLGFDRKVLEQFGLGQASSAEAFTGVMNNLVLAKLAEQKGPQTDQDAARIQATMASLGNTPEATDFLMGTAAALAQRNVDRLAFYEQYKASTGSFNGAGAAWRQHTADQPLVGTNPESNRPVFYNEFERAMQEDNPGMDQGTIRRIWAEKYGGKMTKPDTAGQAANAGKAVGTLASFATEYFAQNPNATLDQIRQAWEAATNGR